MSTISENARKLLSQLLENVELPIKAIVPKSSIFMVYSDALNYQQIGCCDRFKPYFPAKTKYDDVFEGNEELLTEFLNDIFGDELLVFDKELRLVSLYNAKNNHALQNYMVFMILRIFLPVGTLILKNILNFINDNPNWSFYRAMIESFTKGYMGNSSYNPFNTNHINQTPTSYINVIRNGNINVRYSDKFNFIDNIDNKKEKVKKYLQTSKPHFGNSTDTRPSVRQYNSKLIEIYIDDTDSYNKKSHEGNLPIKIFEYILIDKKQYKIEQSNDLIKKWSIYLDSISGNKNKYLNFLRSLIIKYSNEDVKLSEIIYDTEGLPLIAFPKKRNSYFIINCVDKELILFDFLMKHIEESKPLTKKKAKEELFSQF
jgi:hypothetical protein